MRANSSGTTVKANATVYAPACTRRERFQLVRLDTQRVANAPLDPEEPLVRPGSLAVVVISSHPLQREGGGECATTVDATPFSALIAALVAALLPAIHAAGVAASVEPLLFTFPVHSDSL